MELLVSIKCNGEHAGPDIPQLLIRFPQEQFDDYDLDTVAVFSLGALLAAGWTKPYQFHPDAGEVVASYYCPPCAKSQLKAPDVVPA